MKCLIIILFSFISTSVFCQSNSIKVDFTVSKVDSVLSPSLNLNIKIKFDTVYLCTMDKTPTLSEFICGFGGCLSLTIEKLTNNCFTSLLPDCNTIIPYENINKRVKISNGDSLFASYDISRIIDKTRYLDGTMKFSGIYRAKVFFYYQAGKKQEKITTNWIYIF